jgi:hypothetical protein
LNFKASAAETGIYHGLKIAFLESRIDQPAPGVRRVIYWATFKAWRAGGGNEVILRFSAGYRYSETGNPLIPGITLGWAAKNSKDGLETKQKPFCYVFV